GDGLPPGRAVGGQQVENVAHLLHRRFDDVEDRVLQACVVEVGGRAQAFAHGVDGDEICLIEAVRRQPRSLGRIDLGQGTGAQFVGGLQPLGGVVVETVGVL